MEFEDRPTRRKGPVCGIENCRSRHYEEGEDGYLYCQNGHRKGELLIGEDEGDYTAARRTTTRKKQDDEGMGKVRKGYRGKDATDLYLKCLQLILRHQISFLITTANLPSELELIVHDLWVLRILQLDKRVTDNTSDSQPSSSQAFSASENEETDTEAGSGAEMLTINRKKKLERVASMVDLLALCYLGCLTLRLPVTPGDIWSWITEGDMPWRRAIRFIPPAMKENLPGHYRAELFPSPLLSYRKFYRSITDLKVSLRREYGITWPKLNTPLLLFRALRDLGLPLEVYSAALRVATIVGYSFDALPKEETWRIGVRHLPEAQMAACVVLAVKLLYPFDYRDVGRYPASFSEPAAAVVNWKEWDELVAALKMKKKENSTRDEGNEDEVEVGEEGEKHEKKVLTAEEMLKLEGEDVFSLSTEQMDQYLDFYTTSFVDEARWTAEGNSGWRNALFEIFPVPGPAPGSRSNQPPSSSQPLSDPNDPKRPNSTDPTVQEKLEFVREVHRFIRPNRAVEEGEDARRTLRPGAKYAVWNEMDDVPENAKRFCEEVGRLIGVDVDMLVLVVGAAERKLVEMRRRKAVGKKGRE